MLNKQIVQGRLTRDPELKTTQNGVSVCRFTIASDDDVKRADGTRDTDFVDCVAWRGTAEFVSKFTDKGRMIVVVGRPKTNRYDDKNGVSHKTVELRVDDVYFADSKPATNNEQTAPIPAPADAPSAPAGFMDVDVDPDEDLPF